MWDLSGYYENFISVSNSSDSVSTHFTDCFNIFSGFAERENFPHFATIKIYIEMNNGMSWRFDRVQPFSVEELTTKENNRKQNNNLKTYQTTIKHDDISEVSSSSAVIF